MIPERFELSNFQFTCSAQEHHFTHNFFFTPIENIIRSIKEIALEEFEISTSSLLNQLSNEA